MDSYHTAYPSYSQTGLDYSQIPSQSSSNFHYTSSSSPFDFNLQTQPPFPQQDPSYSHPPPASYPYPNNYVEDQAPRPLKPRVTKNVAHPRQIQIAHPYARLFAKKDEVKRRKIWNHALEKSLFDAYELSTLGAPNRRTIYIASLEAHVDRLHSQLLELGFFPIPFSELEPFKGLNSKTAKSMVAGLQHDASVSKLKLLELERANRDLTKVLSNLPGSP
ncbi:hypothetical protein B0H34DRAFT_792687 [Crassisporium funariophilum]|nr:hypothetical protein B0H34DRAFT_792687 [Crassisporium funariophilum]